MPKNKKQYQGGYNIMGFRIQNNIEALNAQRNLQVSSTGLSKSLQRLSSGYRINSAADDAAGLAVSQQVRADIASYKVASQNVSEANALLQVAEGAMDQIGNILTRLKELATQAASANAGANVDKLNAEGNALIAEMDRNAGSTKYANTKLLDGSFGVTASSGGTFTAGVGYSSVSGLQSGLTYTVAVAANGSNWDISVTATIGGGANTWTAYNVAAPGAGETAEVSFGSLGLTLKVNEDLDATGGTIVANAATASLFQVGTSSDTNDQIGILIGSATSTDLSIAVDQLLSASDSRAFLDTINTAITYLSGKRGDVGAAQNRLTYASANLSVTIENYVAAESTIRDVNMASEMTTFTKNQILVQAGTAMLAQANMAPQLVLSLFGNG
jgi:flagellin